MQSGTAAVAAADTVRVGTDCAVWVRPGADWPRRQLDKTFHDTDLCYVASWPGNGATWWLGLGWGAAGQGDGSQTGTREKG